MKLKEFLTSKSTIFLYIIWSGLVLFLALEGGFTRMQFNCPPIPGGGYYTDYCGYYFSWGTVWVMLGVLVALLLLSYLMILAREGLRRRKHESD